MTLEFSNDFIIGRNDGSESKIATTELEEINEIRSAIFIRIKGGQAFVVPKDKIANIDSVRERLKELAAYLKINYELDENWEWK